jgi:aminomuconate-semialdehyde/2-hydroxymuconate-6-semialdehyde dehydrogenase
MGLDQTFGAAMTAHPKIGTISFTGALLLDERWPKHVRRCLRKVSLELGGKIRILFFADADQDAAISGSLRSSFANQGQVCLCGSRVFVERPAYQEFVDRFVEKASQLRVGDPLEGPLIKVQSSPRCSSTR